MKRHSQNLHLNFDPDAAGAKAAERSIKLLLDENVRVRVVELEGGLDPDEFCKEHGAEAYRERIANAKPYFYWLADRARGRFNMRDPQGRNDVFQFLLPAIQGLSDKIERVSVANDLASYLGIESGLVLEHFRKMAADRVEHAPAVQSRSRARYRPHPPRTTSQRRGIAAGIYWMRCANYRAGGGHRQRDLSKLLLQCTMPANTSRSTRCMNGLRPLIRKNWHRSSGSRQGFGDRRRRRGLHRKNAPRR